MSTFDPTVPQTRSFQIRASDSEKRTITGIAVPYDNEVQIYPGLCEKFAPGSIDDEGAILRYGHREPIGKITAATDTPAGRHIEGVISETERGREVATLVVDGVLTRMSIGFEGIEHLSEDREDGTTLITWTKVKAREYSIVEFPAYPDATIESIRQRQEKEKPMTDTITRADLDQLADELRMANEDTTRKLSLIETGLATTRETHTPFQFRSLGEYAHALIGKAGEAAKEMATRAFAGAVVGDSVERPAWLGVLEKRLQAKQEVTNLFTHTYDLPAEGMSVEYGKRAEDSTVKVDEQAAEGDTLAFGKTGTYETANAPVKTYGGYSEMSFQAIERASVSLLDDLLYDQAFFYATQIETVTRNLFTSLVTVNENTPVFTLSATPTVDEWIEAALTLADAYDDTPYVMDGLAVSKDVFLQLARLPEDRKALKFSGEPDDKQGTLTIATGSGNFLNLVVKRIPRWTGAHASGYAKEAIRVKESPGAPLRLQDSSVVDLSKTFAVYGYAAHFAPKPGLLKPLKFGA